MPPVNKNYFWFSYFLFLIRILHVLRIVNRTVSRTIGWDMLLQHAKTYQKRTEPNRFIRSFRDSNRIEPIWIKHETRAFSIIWCFFRIRFDHSELVLIAFEWFNTMWLMHVKDFYESNKSKNPSTSTIKREKFLSLKRTKNEVRFYLSNSDQLIFFK